MVRACPNRIETVNLKPKSIRFRECFGRGAQTESKREKRNAAETHRELQPTGRSKLCPHAENLALGNTVHQSSRRTRRHIDPRRSLGLPWRWWRARPMLTPRNQTLNFTKSELPAIFSRAACMLKPSPIIFALACTQGNKGPRTSGCCCGSPAGYLRGSYAAVLPC